MKKQRQKAGTDVKLAEAEKLLQKAADYVANVQPQLDKYAELTNRFNSRASQVAGVLVDRGIIPSAQTSTLLHKFAEDPVKALDMIAHMARLVGPDTLGKSADISVPKERKLDAFEALVLNGDPSITYNESPAMVD